MVSMLLLSAVDRGFDPRSGKTKGYKIDIASPLSMQHKGERAKTGRLKIRIMCSSGATWLSTVFYFSELTL